MGEDHWELVYEASGQLEAEMLRGLLEAQGLTVFLSMEGAGHAFALTVGPLGLVQVLVPDSQAEEALEIVQSYQSALELPDETEESSSEEDIGEDGQVSE